MSPSTLEKFSITRVRINGGNDIDFEAQPFGKNDSDFLELTLKDASSRVVGEEKSYRSPITKVCDAVVRLKYNECKQHGVLCALNKSVSETQQHITETSKSARESNIQKVELAHSHIRITQTFIDIVKHLQATGEELKKYTTPPEIREEFPF